MPNTISSPILNLSNNKIIGIHYNNSTYYNKGIFLKKIIKDFINYYKIKNKINERFLNPKINNIIKIKIDAVDFKEKEKIYFLDNYKFQDNEGKYHFQDNSKELNTNNTELYINGKKLNIKSILFQIKRGLIISL